MVIAEAPKVQQRYSEVTGKQSCFLVTMTASAAVERQQPIQLDNECDVDDDIKIWRVIILDGDIIFAMRTGPLLIRSARR
jgi:hypothetical protein